MSICIQKIKVRYQSSQEILKFNKYLNLIDWEHALACPFHMALLVTFIAAYLPTNN